MAGEIGIRVDHNAQGVRADMRRIALTQLPFAGSKALNATAADVADNARASLSKKFKIRNKKGNRGVRTQFMKKPDWPKRGPRVEWRDYLAQHEKGARPSAEEAPGRPGEGGSAEGDKSSQIVSLPIRGKDEDGRAGGAGPSLRAGNGA